MFIFFCSSHVPINIFRKNNCNSRIHFMVVQLLEFLFGKRFDIFSCHFQCNWLKFKWDKLYINSTFHSIIFVCYHSRVCFENSIFVITIELLEIFCASYHGRKIDKIAILFAIITSTHTLEPSNHIVRWGKTNKTLI